ncbi:PaaI family thioesterase [soil metagenome]
MTLSIDQATELLGNGFSPWVGELKLSFEEVSPERVVMRMPFDPRLCREGGIVCGQAFMAAADTIAVFAMWGSAGEVRACTTVGASVQMMRPVSDADVLAEARVLRLGRSMAFVDVLLHADGDPRPAVAANVTLALV